MISIGKFVDIESTVHIEKTFSLPHLFFSLILLYTEKKDTNADI